MKLPSIVHDSKADVCPPDTKLACLFDSLPGRWSQAPPNRECQASSVSSSCLHFRADEREHSLQAAAERCCPHQPTRPAVVPHPSWEILVSGPAEWWDNRSTEHEQGRGHLRAEKNRGACTSLFQGLQELQPGATCCGEGKVGDAVEALEILVHQGSHVDTSVFYGVLKKCISAKDLFLGRRVHKLVVQGGLESNSFLAKHVIGMYASHRSLEEARQAFAMVSAPSQAVWASMILAYSRNGKPVEAINLYCQMRQSSVQPTCNVFVAVLRACAVTRDLSFGRQVHDDVLGIADPPGMVVIGTCLVDMYSKCGSLQDARLVFDNMPTRDAVTWNAMITGYTQNGLGEEALTLYVSMQRDGTTSANPVTFVCLLQACASIGALHRGKQLHSEIQERELKNDVLVGTNLVDMYAKCKSLDDARAVFDGMRTKNVVTWNALITGYVQQGLGQEALALYGSMRQEGVTPPNHVTFVCILQACASVEALKQGMQLHAEILERGLETDVVVGTSLVDMYAKCKSLDDARRAFDNMPTKDVVTWNAIIGGYAQQGLGHEALNLYASMQLEGIIRANARTYVHLLQACSTIGDRQAGEQLHAQIEEQGLVIRSDVVLGNCLVNMYAKCGRLEDARRVFDSLQSKNVATWNAMITACVQNGLGQESLALYASMLEERSSLPDAVTFTCLLQACASTNALKQGKALHAHAQEIGLESDATVSNGLVSMYAKCGSLEDARTLFDNLTSKDVVTWNAMIAGYAHSGRAQEALTLYDQMEQDGIVVADAVTFVCLLQACAFLGNLRQGRHLHAQIDRRGLAADVVVGNSLVHMYAKCGSVGDAREVFDNLSGRNVVTWNSMISAYTQSGLGEQALALYTSMVEEKAISAANVVTFVSLLQACAVVGALEVGKQLHQNIREAGFDGDVVVSNGLVNMYSKCGNIADARQVFDNLPSKNVVTWNAMISGYVLRGMWQEAVNLYGCMQVEPITRPDAATYVSLLKACASLQALPEGKKLHSEIQERGMEQDVVVGTCLVDMYAKCQRIDDARGVFDSLSTKTVVTWNAMLAAYAEHKLGEDVFLLYESMQLEKAATPDSVTFVHLLQACPCITGSLDMGKKLHVLLQRRGLYGDISIGNCLINMYSKCRSLEDARKVFDNMPARDVVTWNAMLGAYVQDGLGHETLQLYESMRMDGTCTANSITFACLLHACGNVAALEKGKELHASLSDFGVEATEPSVASSLIDMYGKCGSILDAQRVFDALPIRDVVTWNALIAGYARQGESESVFVLFDKMKQDGIDPNSVTFTSILASCCHGGLVDKGQRYFESMTADYNIPPGMVHYSCMVDLLGRAGLLEKAMETIRMMSFRPDGVIWRSLLSSCRKWNNVELGRYAFECALELDEHDVAAYVLMANIYTASHMFEEGKQIQVLRRKAQARKKPGQTCWSDISGFVHTFLVGERLDPAAQNPNVGLR